MITGKNDNRHGLRVGCIYTLINPEPWYWNTGK